MVQSTKGLSILSEAILAIGVIAIAIMFALITGNIIGFQSQGFLTGSQQEITDDISSRIDMISAYNGTTAITYQPTVSQYRLRVTEQSIISVQLPNQRTQSTSFEDVKLENTRIEDAETLCIRKKGQKIAITAGNCSTQLSNFCANGRCINGQCQPERGETCGNAPADCSCPTYLENPSDGSNACQPGYTAGNHMPGSGAGDSTKDAIKGCVKQGFVDQQAEGERCEYDFECQSNMRCSSLHPTADPSLSGKRCCPPGESWDGTSCKEDDRLNMVFIPVNYNPSESGGYTAEAQTYYNKFLQESPFRACGSPSDRVKKHTVSIDTGGSCDFTCNNCAPGTLAANVKACGEQEYPEAEVYMGVCKGTSCCTSCLPSGGAYCGFYTSTYDVTVTQAANTCGWETAVHEVGHQWGLAHVNGELTTQVAACNPDPADDCHGENDAAPNDPDCNDDVNEKKHYFLSYCSNSLITEYGPAAYNHLKNNALADYLEGCFSP